MGEKSAEACSSHCFVLFFAMLQNKVCHFIDAVLGLGIDAGVVEIGMAEALIEHHLCLYPCLVELDPVAQSLHL